jgi:hypothetical protein
VSTVQEMKQALKDAESEIRKVDLCIEDMVSIIVGRLRSVRHPDYDRGYRNNLALLKRELRAFNISTKLWNAPK